MTSHIAINQSSFDEIYTHLQSIATPLRPPKKPTNPKLTDTIASLYVHPALETALHLLNNDLYSAHFLCRHMEASPAHEGMYLHGILHRLEGDYDNARAWYRDVASSDVYSSVWQNESSDGQDLINQTEALVSSSETVEVDETILTDGSMREIVAVVEFCKNKFGTKPIRDASGSWVQPDGELKKLGEDMVSGNEGFRNF